jgi:hypothetical protein
VKNLPTHARTRTGTRIFVYIYIYIYMPLFFRVSREINCTEMVKLLSFISHIYCKNTHNILVFCMQLQCISQTSQTREEDLNFLIYISCSFRIRPSNLYPIRINLELWILQLVGLLGREISHVARPLPTPDRHP